MSNMAQDNFDESKIRRGQPQNAGQFARKETSTPQGSLAPAEAQSADAPRPLNVQVLDRPDPDGGFDMQVATPTGSRFFRNGHLHRVGEPAYVGTDGTLEYRRDGELDRADGPAYVDADGYEEHWVGGRLLQAA